MYMSSVYLHITFMFQLYAGDLHLVQMEELVEDPTTVHAELDGVAIGVQQVL